MTVHTLKLGTMDNLLHILADQASGQALVVDAAWDAAAILQCLHDNQLQLSGILLTHSHWDHTSAVNDLLAIVDVPVYMSLVEHQLGLFDIQSPRYVGEGDEIAFGQHRIRVIETPGHTKGSVCYYVDEVLIAGDTLFVDGCGRCNFPESDIDSMWGSLQRLKQLPDSTMIHGGHDYGRKATDSLGNQKRTNPYLLIHDEAFFKAFRMDLQSNYRSIPFAPSSCDEVNQIAAAHGFL